MLIKTNQQQRKRANQLKIIEMMLYHLIRKISRNYRAHNNPLMKEKLHKINKLVDLHISKHNNRLKRINRQIKQKMTKMKKMTKKMLRYKSKL